MKFKEIISEFLGNFILFFIFLISLTSIFFLPNNPWIMLSKQYFLIGCASFLLIFWTAWIILNKKFRFIGSKWIYLFPIIFLIGALISSLFSLYRHGSFWGNESWSLSFLSIASLIVVFLVLINYLDKEKLKRFLYVFLGSVALAQIIFLLFVAEIFTFSWMNANLIGQNISLGFISALSLMVCAGLFIHYLYKKKSAFKKSYLVLLAAINIIVLLMINIRSVWALLITGSVLLMLFGFLRDKKFDIRKFAFPIVILVLAIILIAAGKLNSFPQVETEVLPNYSTSFKIAKQSFLDRPLTGVGLNNYSLAYNFYRPDEVNQTAFWSNPFYYSSSKVLDLWSTGGVVAILSYLAFIIYFSYFAIKNLLDKKQDEILLGLGVGWLMYAVGNFLFMSNAVIDLFALFMLAGIVVYIWKERKKKRISKAKKYLTVTIAAVLLLASIFTLCLSIKRFVAAQAFFQARKYAFDVNLQPQIEKWVEFASRWDSENDNYQRQLANLYIIGVNNVKSIQPTENNKAQIDSILSQFVKKANASAVKAAEINPNNYLNHLIVADLYLATQGLASNALSWSEKALQEALQKFPNNVFIINRLAESQLTQARELILARQNLLEQNQDTSSVDEEINNFLASAMQNAQKAIELKNDYLAAYYNLALIEWESGNTDQSIIIMENLQKQAPNDIGVKFYLALMYDQSKQADKAIDLLKQAVELAPNFTDGYWALARIYYAQGQVSTARQTLEKILEYDPQNQNVQQVLDNLSQIQAEPEIVSPSIPVPDQADNIEQNVQD